MNFSDFESLMRKNGVNSLAEIARILDTTPQAVSNWKGRDQVPHHILNKVTTFFEHKHLPQREHPSQLSKMNLEDKQISLSDFMLVMAQQLKIILLVPILTIFLSYTYVKFVQKPLYTSSATLLLPSNKKEIAGIVGLASQFGVNVPNSSSADLSSPTLLPELLMSRTFAEILLISASSILI